MSENIIMTANTSFDHPVTDYSKLKSIDMIQ